MEEKETKMLKVIKGLSKKYDKNWKKLTVEQRQQVKNYLVSKLEEMDKNWNARTQAINAKLEELTAFVNSEYAEEFADVIKKNRITDKLALRIEKEEQKQKRIMTENNPELLLGDIVISIELEQRALSTQSSVIEKADALMQGDIGLVSVIKSAQVHAVLSALSYNHEKSKDVFKNQKNRVEELLDIHARDNEMEK